MKSLTCAPTDLISKPWFVTGCPANVAGEADNSNKQIKNVSLDMINDMVEQLNKLARTNVKGLAEVAKHSQTSLQMELSRIEAHNKNVGKLFDNQS